MATEAVEVADETVNEAKVDHSILLDTSSIIDGRILDVIKRDLFQIRLLFLIL